jgi:hypothetical protein
MKKLFGSTLVLVILATNVGASLPAAGAASGRRPRMARAVVQDADRDGRADRVVVTYRSRIRHRKDTDGSYPFRVAGYGIRSVKAARGRRLVILLSEAADRDPTAHPAVRYRNTRRQPVTSLSGRRAARQRFGRSRSWGVMLTVANTGAGAGRVNSTPAGISCAASSCSYGFRRGSSVVLDAVANAGSVWTSWAGDCLGETSSTCTVTMNAGRQVTATWGGLSSLDVSILGVGSGGVVSTEVGIDCEPECSADFTTGLPVTLTAVADPGSVFTGWGGACASFELLPVCTITIDSDEAVSATFGTVIPAP